MRVKLNTISQIINRANPAVTLPRNSIHDAYCLKYRLKIKNTSSLTATPKMEDVLRAIESIVLTSDSQQVHYSLGGLDLARRNAMASACGTDQVLFRELSSMAPDATKDISFVLYLDEGDIIAVGHNNLELKSTFLQTAGDDFSVIDPECKITIVESIPSTDELYAKYGKELEYVEEPKVYAITEKCSANTEFTGFFDLPTGTLLKGAMIHFSKVPELVGIIQNSPDRTELEKVDWDTIRAIDERKYRTKLPENVITFDYGTQWQDNGLGKDGWSFNKGEKQIACKTSEEVEIRYVSFERIVNIDLYKATVQFTKY